jgi:hypothetical protein
MPKLMTIFEKYKPTAAELYCKPAPPPQNPFRNYSTPNKKRAAAPEELRLAELHPSLSFLIEP